jgi:hypothetical protein
MGDPGVDEGLFPLWTLVADAEDLEARTLDRLERSCEIRHPERDVVEASGGVALEKPVEERRVGKWLEQFDLRAVAEPEVNSAVPQRGVVRRVLKRAAEGIAVERQQIVELPRGVGRMIEGRVEAGYPGVDQAGSSTLTARALMPV